MASLQLFIYIHTYIHTYTYIKLYILTLLKCPVGSTIYP